MAAALSSANQGAVLRAFIDYSDELARHGLADQFELAASEPESTGSPAWDAALAGLVDFLLQPPKPSWIELPNRFLPSPATPQLGRYDLPPDLSDVPPEFLRCNIFMERRILQSV